jgi:hypothetical protein
VKAPGRRGSSPAGFATAAEQALARKQLSGGEKGFQKRVREYAELRGWADYSIPDSRRATDRGWPDDVLRHAGDRAAPLDRVRWLVLEHKDVDGVVRPDQVVWLDAWAGLARAANRGAGYEMVAVWITRPAIEDDICRLLDGHGWRDNEQEKAA